MLADILAAAASGTALVAATGRAARNDGTGLSLTSQASHTTLGLIWLAYCSAEGLLVGAVSAGAWSALGVALSVKAHRRGHGTLLLPTAILAAAAGTWLAFGPAGLTLMLGLAPLVAEAPQIRALMRADAAALSTTAYLLGSVRSAAWLPYAIVNSDPATLLWAACAAATSLLVAALLLRHRLPARRATRAAERPRES